ncbi:hypothetical protein ACJX0J_030891, partial [Zea mays]
CLYSFEFAYVDLEMEDEALQTGIKHIINHIMATIWTKSKRRVITCPTQERKLWNSTFTNGSCYYEVFIILRLGAKILKRLFPTLYLLHVKIIYIVHNT